MLPRICLLYANRPEAVYVYVNIRNQYVCLPGIDRQDCIVVLSCFILCLCCNKPCRETRLIFFMC